MGISSNHISSSSSGSSSSSSQVKRQGYRMCVRSSATDKKGSTPQLPSAIQRVQGLRCDDRPHKPGAEMNREAQFGLCDLRVKRAQRAADFVAVAREEAEMMRIQERYYSRITPQTSNASWVAVNSAILRFAI
ncbi:uncharacterized protein MONBRDRAFT_12935 [Monosiga brevicollis MX1]|uniref:Uncharacterized protein n=1 Tax=Monosiga brevicollis TaxID=81824 RepID=A9VDS4_MONBE|nr:uncharacterized protein MONBRDRAFT_12935 [Monosiga brevicollis MX1]EDQ84298.1 predicted protein [Monosiga brevicollis MX1]|eukprot:XP_001750868.1 hypothetical protein [Monosiga brevicollis MX1]